MNILTSLQPYAKAVVIGASGGIGAALVSALHADAAISVVKCFARSGCGDDTVDSSVRHIDITDEASVQSAAEVATSDGPLDLVIVATGILHDENIRPEKTMRDIDGDIMAEVIRINTIGPALVAKHFLPHMCRGGKSVFAVLSARVGSIGDNRLGGWVSYRASKAATNMLLKTLSIEQARRRPESASALQLLRVIDGVSAKDTGGFFAWDGQTIPY
jgi:NAD(P)-dependent dehydrogenase (short-subunit alcohol dehydrogenase family)